MDEMDKATTENSVDIKKITPSTVRSEYKTKIRNRQNKENSCKLKWKLISQIFTQ